MTVSLLITSHSVTLERNRCSGTLNVTLFSGECFVCENLCEPILLIILFCNVLCTKMVF